MAKTTLIDVVPRAPSNFNKFMKMRLSELKADYENHRERFSAAALEWKMMPEDAKKEAMDKAIAYVEGLNEPPKAPRKKRVAIDKLDGKVVKNVRGPSVYNLYISKLMSDDSMVSEVPDRKERFKAVVQKYSMLSKDEKEAIHEEFKDKLVKVIVPAPETPANSDSDDVKTKTKKKATKKKEQTETTDNSSSDSEAKPKAKRASKPKPKPTATATATIAEESDVAMDDVEATKPTVADPEPVEAEPEAEAEEETKPKKKRAGKAKN